MIVGSKTLVMELHSTFLSISTIPMEQCDEKFAIDSEISVYI